MVSSMKISRYLDNLESLENKEIIVTGGTSGIGLSIVHHLLYKHANMIILARNKNKSLEVKTNLLKIYPDAKIDFIYYSQDDLASIDAAIKEIVEHHPNFYAMIFNAGIFARDNYQNELSLTMKTNFIGTGYFLKKLVPLLQGEHRLIIQGSLVAGWRNKKIKELEDKTSSFNQYIISKSGVEALYHYYSNINKDSISFYLVEPGLTSTEIIRDFPKIIRFLGKIFLKVFSHSSSKAALTALLALQSNVKPCFIVPRGPFTMRGYPKIKAFPKKRHRTELLSKLDKYI